MNASVGAAIWQQFGAAIDTLENAINACPDHIWSDRAARPEYWYLAYHTLFFLDLYLSDSRDGFAPPEPFTLDELDPAGLLPDRVYRKEELLSYLAHGRAKCKARIEALSDGEQASRHTFGWITFGPVEALLYNLRHVQHHAAQLNLILRQRVDSAPDWVARANDE